jgi:type IV secretion system protein VirB3
MRGAAYFTSLDGGMLVFGCERTPFGIVVGAGIGPLYVALFALLSGSFLVAAIAAAAGVALLCGGIYALRRMARHDPMMVRVYLRNRRYRRFYPARSGPWCNR